MSLLAWVIFAVLVLFAIAALFGPGETSTYVEPPRPRRATMPPGPCPAWDDECWDRYVDMLPVDDGDPRRDDPPDRECPGAFGPEPC